MSRPSMLIAELIRTANTVEKLAANQRQRLFGRAYMEVTELRRQAGSLASQASSLESSRSVSQRDGSHRGSSQ